MFVVNVYSIYFSLKLANRKGEASVGTRCLFFFFIHSSLSIAQHGTQYCQKISSPSELLTLKVLFCPLVVMRGTEHCSDSGQGSNPRLAISSYVKLRLNLTFRFSLFSSDIE